MPDYREDRKWSDQFIPAIKQIVGPRLLTVASFDLDTKEATDLLVFRAADLRIAARVRRPGYADEYPNEFTIRSMRDSGTETELAKIVSGWGDWLFYGHAASNGPPFEIGRWMIVDLRVFRLAYHNHMVALATRNSRKQTIKFTRQNNKDGTYFIAFDYASFPQTPSVLIACSDDRLIAA